mmetsp:Transcript_11912/g.18048  ORF Transcript_11912/g.18048 Transcript_11912/m.18048 type:complete len:120 (-) Transcript_11912:91-450(-)
MSHVLNLYRSILRLHTKHLPKDMRALGDAYVQSEFRLHKDVTNEEHLNRFFSGWKDYIEHIEQTARARNSKAAGLADTKNDNTARLYSFGASLNDEIDLTDEQKEQLMKLKDEASGLTK